MNILVTGNLGYIGPVLGREIKKWLSDSNLIGLDSGLFAQCTTAFGRLGDTYYDKQYHVDSRDISDEMLAGVDTVVHLAAISNDPMGNEFAEVTRAVNQTSSVELAKRCSRLNVRRFVFASSCSMYGEAGEQAKRETDSLAPLTTYAKSKIGVENELKSELVDSPLQVTYLRFATACGASDRLRLDLVLNDFVASALKYDKISILSDGTPWRPLIDVEDMASAIMWACTRSLDDNTNHLSINIGSDDWNFQVKDLAMRVADHLPKARVEVNENAPPDKRSYKVDFSLYKSLAGKFYPRKNIDDTIEELIQLTEELDLPRDSFRNSKYIRLNHLRKLKSHNYLGEDLRWLK